MLEQVKFINHINEVIEFGRNGVFINENDLHDYEWEYESQGDKLSYFKRGIVKKSIPVVVACNSSEEGKRVINNIMEYSEKDILAKIPGKIIINNYYLSGYIVGSSKSDYLFKKGYLKADLIMLSDTPAWIKESVFSFGVKAAGGKVLDFNYDYPHDFTSSVTNVSVYNTGFADSDFKMIIYGDSENPEIYIDDHMYKVTCKIESHEYLTINSKDKTIILTKRDGSKVNLFKNRDKSSYIFQKIKPGQSKVTWEGEYKFDVTLLEERSEPKWI